MKTGKIVSDEKLLSGKFAISSLGHSICVKINWALQQGARQCGLCRGSTQYRTVTEYPSKFFRAIDPPFK